MTQVISFSNYTPTSRYDATPWTDVRIQEADAADAADVDWTTIETIALSPVDADPTEPASRDFTTDQASDTAGLWYRLVFVDAAVNTLLPTAPVQNVSPITAYVSTDELARILKIRQPTDDQRDAMERVLLTAAGEINSEISLASDEGLSGWQVALAQEVNLERAVEHWRQQESPFGFFEVAAGLSERTARDSWERHAHKLAPLKSGWGVA